LQHRIGLGFGILELSLYLPDVPQHGGIGSGRRSGVSSYEKTGKWRGSARADQWCRGAKRAFDAAWTYSQATIQPRSKGDSVWFTSSRRNATKWIRSASGPFHKPRLLV